MKKIENLVFEKCNWMTVCGQNFSSWFPLAEVKTTMAVFLSCTVTYAQSWSCCSLRTRWKFPPMRFFKNSARKLPILKFSWSNSSWKRSYSQWRFCWENVPLCSHSQVVTSDTVFGKVPKIMNIFYLTPGYCRVGTSCCRNLKNCGVG